MRSAPETSVTTTMTPREMLRSISLSAGKAGRAERAVKMKVVECEVVNQNTRPSEIRTCRSKQVRTVWLNRHYNLIFVQAFFQHLIAVDNSWVDFTQLTFRPDFSDV